MGDRQNFHLDHPCDHVFLQCFFFPFPVLESTTFLFRYASGCKNREETTPVEYSMWEHQLIEVVGCFLIQVNTLWFVLSDL